MTPLQAPAAASVTSLLAQRRSIRRLAGGALSPDTVARLQDAVVRTPSAFGVTPWQIVILQEQRDAFWDEVAASSPRAGKVVEIFKKYAANMEKAGYPYR